MIEIKIVDARMGRGKSSAAIRYMNENKGDKKFIYITPFLSEVDRICTSCDFAQPESGDSTKLSDLKRLVDSGQNISSTHALFQHMSSSIMDTIKEKHYTLIIDESINLIEKVSICHCDLMILLEQLTIRGADGRLIWKDNDYRGVFSEYKKCADAGFLYASNDAVLKMVRPSILESFDEVYMLTYIFEGQYQKAYLDFFGFNYRIIGVKEDENGYYLSDEIDSPAPIDYGHLINIVTKDRMNRIGSDRHSLSKNWYSKRGVNNQDIKILRNNLHSFFRYADKDERLWTTFKNAKDKIINNGRYKHNFLQISSRATNDHRNKTYVAYLANRFPDPNIRNFFLSRGIKVDDDKFALSEMIQWIWRSAIRDDKPINLYIPSKRMRELFINWLEEQNYMNAEDMELCEDDSIKTDDNIDYALYSNNQNID